MKKLTLSSLAIFLFHGIFIAQLPVKNVLVEETTGTWCMFCPRGAVYGKQMEEAYPDESVFVAVHWDDVMENLEHFEGTELTGSPSGYINRTTFTGFTYGNMESEIGSLIPQTAPASISISYEFDPVSRFMGMVLSADVAEDMTGDYRMMAMIVENGITGPSPTYDQWNWYADSIEGEMGGYESLPYLVPSEFMLYNHVSRKLLGGYDGAVNSWPETLIASQSYTQSFFYTLPEAYNEELVYIVAVLLNNETGEVVNVEKSHYIVGNANAEPFFHSDPVELVYLGNDYFYDIVSHDIECGELDLTTTSGPSWLSFEDLGNGRGTLSGTPTEAGVYEVALSLTDGTYTVQQEFEVVVEDFSEGWVIVGDEGLGDYAAVNIHLEFDNDNVPWVMYSNNITDEFYTHKFESNNWLQYGENTWTATPYQTAFEISPQNVPHVYTNRRLFALGDDSWEQLGQLLEANNMFSGDLCFQEDGPTYVVNNGASDGFGFTHNGLEWDAIGELAGTSDSRGIRMVTSNENVPLVLYYTFGDGEIGHSYVEKWNGTGWEILSEGPIDPDFTTAGGHDIAIGPNNELYVAISINDELNTCNVYEFIDDTWEIHSENVTNSGTSNCQLEVDADGVLFLAYKDGDEGNKASVVKYELGEWSYVGLPGFTPTTNQLGFALDHNGIPYLAFRDVSVDNHVTVKKFYTFVPDGVEELESDNKHARLYPNPNNGSFTLATNFGEYFEVYDVLGQLVLKQNMQNISGSMNEQSIHLRNHPEGVYIIQIIDKNKSESLRFVLKK